MQPAVTCSFLVSLLFVSACTSTDHPKPLIDAHMRSIMSYDEANKLDVEHLIRELAMIDSPTQNKVGVHQALVWVEQELHALNFETKWDETYGHLIAVHKGSSSPILLVAHADTVKTLAENPFRVDGVDLIRGAGVSDDKGGIVVAIQAMRTLQRTNQLKELSIRFYIGADEEHAARPLSASRQSLRDLARGCKFGIGLENGNNKAEEVITERRGIVGWNLSLTTLDGHSSLVGRDPEKDGRGVGAVYGITGILAGFYTWFIGTDVPSLASVNTDTLSAGTTSELSSTEEDVATAHGKRNSIPSSAHASGEMRSLSMKEDTAYMQELVDRSKIEKGMLTSEIQFDEAYPAMQSKEKTLFDAYRITCENMDGSVIKKANPRSVGASDLSFVSDLIPSVVDGIGTKGGSADHSIQETASIKGMRKASVRLAILLSRLK